MDFSDGSGAFSNTPSINVGGFSAGTAGDTGVYVPETGLYQIDGWAQFEANGVGTRYLWLLDEAAEIGGTRINISSHGSDGIR